MSVTPEGKTKQHIKNLLDMEGCWKFMPVQMGYGTRTLDFLCCRPSDKQFFMVEAKKRGGEPRPEQWKTIRDARAKGIRVFVIDDQEADGLGIKHESIAALRAWIRGEGP
jgi:hypothetical protein